MDSLSVYNLKQVFINISDMENYIKKKKKIVLYWPLAEANTAAR